MLISFHPATRRGHSVFDWLDSRHTFSFGGFHDPARMGISVLRVINDDRVAPGAGFDTHPHRDMEILSYVLEGTMAHRDSTGATGLIEAGQFQMMSAGSGIRHSEFNASREQPLHFLQIWLVPDRTGGAPGYQQRDFPRAAGSQLIASPDGRDGSLRWLQDACLTRVLVAADDSYTVLPYAGRMLFLHGVSGTLACADGSLGGGDGMALRLDAPLVLRAEADSEALLFDLPG